jgi:DNA-binding HxlR family transcriptional regulator
MTNKRQQEYTCAMDAALNVISGKWKLVILNRLLTGPQRYSEIHKSIPGLTEKVLSQQLKELEEDQIVKRKVYPVVPPKVEYSFTELGEELQPVFFALERWGSNFLTETNADGEQVKMDATCYTADKKVPGMLQ